MVEMMTDPVLPTGTVTFFMTDVEGSTRLWEAKPDAMEQALARHDAILLEAVGGHGGALLRHKGEGDSAFAVFARATDALGAAVAAQRALGAEPWPEEVELRVRIAVHTGEAELRDRDYYGSAVNRTARLRGIAHGGQTVISQVTADLVRDRLPEGASLVDLGAHRLPDLGRAEAVFGLAHPDLRSGFPPLRSLEVLPNNLPVQLTSFVGRDQEMVELAGLLGAQRLVTLTGAAGCGKTRLALQVAAEVLEAYRDGVWLVDLAPLGDPDLVTQAVAATLGVRDAFASRGVDALDAGETARPLVELLVEHLRSRELLVVLDNCEHLLEASAELAGTLLMNCPGVGILATSREALGVAGEVSWRVRSLSVPDPKHPPPIEDLEGYEAIRLFVDRARARLPGFVLVSEDGSAVAQVCRRLDGIPLAIELAAARVEVLSVPELAARLDDRFRLLTGGTRTGLERHQTLRAAVDWSYDALSGAERVLLERLSVFAGGCTLEAAEDVCGGGEVEADAVLDLLSQLVAKSLVVMDRRPGGARYRLSETIRQYAREKLVASGDHEELGARHRDWCAALVGRAERGVWGPEQADWFETLEAEEDNLRQALDYTIAARQAEIALQLVGALGRFWMVHGRWEEGQRWLLDALALDEGNAYPFLRAQALNTAALIVLSFLGGAETARSLSSEALAIFRELGTRRGIFWSLNTLSAAALAEGDNAAAASLADEALAVARSAEHDPTIAYALHQRANVAIAQGDNTAAETLLVEALLILRRVDDKTGIARLVATRAVAALADRRYASAVPIVQEALALYRQLGDEFGTFVMVFYLGCAALLTGDHTTARRHFEEALKRSRESGDMYGEVLAFSGRGELALAEGDPARALALFTEGMQIATPTGAAAFASGSSFTASGVAGGTFAQLLAGPAKAAAAEGSLHRAARLFGAAERTRETDAMSHLPARRLLYEHLYEHHIDLVQSGLGDAAFVSEFDDGRAMSLETAVAYALEQPTAGC
jgi:predicted ATPase/class 3 adenylate cyclase